MKNKSHSRSFLFMTLFFFTVSLSAQERIVKVDFESASFINNPKIPFDEAFVIEGEAGPDVEMVKVRILPSGKNLEIESFLWNRYGNDRSSIFSVFVPPILRSNSKYDFEITTYKRLLPPKRKVIINQLENKVRFLLQSSIYYDGKHFDMERPQQIFRKLQGLIDESLKYVASKSNIPHDAPDDLVLAELDKITDLRLKRTLRKGNKGELKQDPEVLIGNRVEHITKLVMSELEVYFNSDLVEAHRITMIREVSTKSQAFTLPVNGGIYAWDKTLNNQGSTLHNINFTPGAGISIPLRTNGRSVQSRTFDSFAISAGVLMKSVRDANATEYVTPGINLPVYAGLGLRAFKIIRINAAAIVLGEKGQSDFSKISFLPSLGLSLELNAWLGIVK